MPKNKYVNKVTPLKGILLFVSMKPGIFPVPFLSALNFNNAHCVDTSIKNFVFYCLMCLNQHK